MFVVTENQLKGLVAPIVPFYGTSTEWLQLEQGQLTTLSDIYRCVSPDTRILMADLSYVPAGKLSNGDEVVGFDEHSENGFRRFRVARVTNTTRGTRNLVRVVTSDGEITCSVEHPFLVLVRWSEESHKFQWVRADELVPGRHTIVSLGPVWEREESYDAGWLSGMFDGEGSIICPRVQLSQAEGPILDRVEALLTERGYVTARSKSPSGAVNLRIQSPHWNHAGIRTEMFRLLGTLRPERLIAKRAWEGMTIKGLRKAEVLEVKALGRGEVVELSTSTKTFVAEGLLSHNTQPAVRSVIDFLASHCGRMPIKVYRRTEDGREHLRDHPVQRLLNVPNGHKRLGRASFWGDVWRDLLIYDRVCLVKIRDLDEGDPVALVRVPPVWFTPFGKNYWWPESIRIIGNRGWANIPIEDCIYIHGYDPVDPRIGTSQMLTLRSMLEEEAAGSAWRRRFWEQGVQPSLVVTRPLEAPDWDDDARDRFIESLRAAQNRGKPLLLEEGMTTNPAAAFDPKQAEYIQTKKFTREEVLRAFNVPVGLWESPVTGGGLAQYRSLLYSEVIAPRLAPFVDELETQLLTDWVDDPYDEGIYLEPAIEEKMRGNIVEQIDSLVRATGRPIMTAKEARDFLNLKGLPDRDKTDDLVLPMNIQPMGTSAPAGTPGGAPPGGQFQPGARPGTANQPANQYGPAKPPTEYEQTTNDAEPHEAQGKDRKYPRRTKAARTPARAKARDSFVKRHKDVIVKHAKRQRAAVTSRVGAGSSLKEAFDKDRWDAELKEDLLPLALTTATYFGTDTADEYGLDYDESRTEDYLDEMTDRSASQINDTTLAALLALAGLSGAALMDGIHSVFDQLEGARADSIADTATTFAENFGIHEVANQNPGTWMKTWNVTSDNPRPTHAAMDGESVPYNEVFSNGMKWPGDPVGGPDETAGCQCVLTLDRVDES